MLLLILPGVGVLFLYDQNVFMQLDWIKLVLLGGAIMAPLVFFNVLILPEAFGELKTNKRDYLFFLISMSIIATSILVYYMAAISYLLGFGAQYCATAILGLEGVLLVIAEYNAWYKSRRRKKKP